MQRHITSVFRTSALCLSLLAAVPALAQAPSTPARQEMSIMQIHDKLTATGYVNIRGIERNRGVVEVKASDKNGTHVKQYLDAVTGEVVTNRREGERNRRHEGRHGSHHQEGAGKDHERSEHHDRRSGAELGERSRFDGR